MGSTISKWQTPNSIRQGCLQRLESSKISWSIKGVVLPDIRGPGINSMLRVSIITRWPPILLARVLSFPNGLIRCRLNCTQNLILFKDFLIKSPIRLSHMIRLDRASIFCIYQAKLSLRHRHAPTGPPKQLQQPDSKSSSRTQLWES